jgi:hypothetical protein
MTTLCLQDLADITGGRLTLAAMPPLDGIWSRVGRVVFKASEAQPGDLFWRLAEGSCDLELAFLRGAAGVVTSGRTTEPWPGRFALRVQNCAHALEAVLMALAGEKPDEEARLSADILVPAEESLQNLPELKVLQLCGRQAVVTFPPTCGQSAKSHAASRCVRRAA